jgi:hypothetical protein
MRKLMASMGIPRRDVPRTNDVVAAWLDLAKELESSYQILADGQNAQKISLEMWLPFWYPYGSRVVH